MKELLRKLGLEVPKQPLTPYLHRSDFVYPTPINEVGPMYAIYRSANEVELILKAAQIRSVCRDYHQDCSKSKNTFNIKIMLAANRFLYVTLELDRETQTKKTFPLLKTETRFIHRLTLRTST